ncbi:GGDEF domain-containing protein [Trichloromonas sp.]|uniref:GGDEF domain-containing protein n=1 Tax=Trichloromonas sp. TaxID=3069249 RepID=UPI002A38FA22|nr:bifunctional diguanylate cyclase/phosphodiesterase [Trichloromonas sp.]
MTCERLSALIENDRLYSYFQPIVDLRSNRIIGYEALLRGPEGSPLHQPDMLFDVAGRCGRRMELELLTRELHIRNFAHLNLPAKLFLNICPFSLMEQKYPRGYTRRFLERHGLSPEQVVIELTEHSTIDDYNLFREALSHYRQMGFTIAIDDLGAGYSGLRLWSELRPEYVKLDRHFVQGINDDYNKQQFVHSLLEIAHGQGCQTIAEGIETPEEYQTIRKIGIHLGQGFLLSRPRPVPVLEPEFSPSQPANKPQGLQRPRRRELTIGKLAQQSPVVAPSTLFRHTGELFDRHPELRSLPVINSNQVAGLVIREDFLNVAASRYGWDLFSKEPIANFMESAPIVIDVHTPLEKISTFLDERKPVYRGQDILVTENGDYAGVVSILTLLRNLSELQIRRAQHANPLTQLPGNVPIQEEIEFLLSNGAPFTACYCDLDHFKAYNDTYGYAAGDTVIKLLAGILSDNAEKESDFIGHIGGDDFIVIFQSTDWQDRCESILKNFAQAIPAHYTRQHRHEGGIWGNNRAGERIFLPLITLSIGAICWRGDIPMTCYDIAHMASEAKAMAKKENGNALFVERRERLTQGFAEETERECRVA